MRMSTSGILGVAALLLLGCSSEQELAESPAKQDAMPAEKPAAMPDTKMPAATVALQPTEGNNVAGLIEFHVEGDSVRVRGSLTGLTPGEHGFHVHENGDCSAPDGSSAGGHYNPDGHDHGGPDADSHHMGDMGNIEAGEDGTANIDARYDFLMVDAEADGSIIGKAVIVHGGADDLSSQPSGAAGPRVACGVIEAG